MKKKIIKIQEPWWGAWKRFGWAKGIWGVSVSKKVVDEAIENKQQIYLDIWRFKMRYKISPVTIKNYSQKNKTQNLAGRNRKVILYTVPNTQLRKAVHADRVKEEEKKEVSSQLSLI